MPLSGRDAPPCRRYRRSPSAVPPTLTRPHVGPRSVPADVLIRRPDLLGHAPRAAQRSVVTRPMYWTSIALLTVVRSGQAGGIKGAEASLMDETLATVSPFALVRRGVGWWSCGDSNPGFSLRRRSRPHRSPVYALHKLHADRHGAPVPSAGGTGGHAD